MEHQAPCANDQENEQKETQENTAENLLAVELHFA
jgi:hypothetical protein